MSKCNCFGGSMNIANKIIRTNEWAHEIEQSQIRDYGPRSNFTFRFITSHNFMCHLYKSKSNKS
jgi:hypothetical protein